MALLRLSGIVKRYGGTHALTGASLAVEAGEIHGLVGANGAGKSTLIKVVTGLVHADRGAIEWRGVRRAAGIEGGHEIGLVMQHSQLCDGLTVSENILLGRYPTRGGPLGWIERRAMTRTVGDLLGRLGVRVAPDVPVARLSLAARRMVEVCKAIARDPRLVILDEPTAALGPTETQALLAVTRELRRQGIAVLLVSHRLGEIVEVCDRVTVLRDGGDIGTLEGSAITTPRLIALMVGDATPAAVGVRAAAVGPAAVDVRALENERVRDVTFTVHQGELAGLTGLAGSGRSTVLRALFGLGPSRGSVAVAGRPLRSRAPWRTTRARMRLVPEDRKEGLIEGLSVVDNLTLPLLASGALSRLGFVRRAVQRGRAAALVKAFGVRVGDIHGPIEHLSGGNQRKAMVAAAVGVEPLVLLVDEPTQGIDVGAKAEVHRLLREFCGNGGSVLAASSEVEECLDLADVLMVMRNGRLAGRLTRPEFSKETVTRLSFEPAGAGSRAGASQES